MVVLAFDVDAEGANSDVVYMLYNAPGTGKSTRLDVR